MSDRLESLARDKQALLMRSALCRLRLRRETHSLKTSLRWKGALASAASAPAMRNVAFALALSLAGIGRTTRMLVIASRVVFAARLARAGINYLRGRNEASVRHRTDARGSGA